MKAKLLIVLSVLCTLSAHAFDDTDSPCENDSLLPQGYRYAVTTSDCVYNENLTPVIKDGLYGYADSTGKVIIAAKYQDAYGFDDGLALIKERGKYGFINATGKQVIKAQYDDAWGFSNQRAKVFKNGKIALIDSQGKTLKTPKLQDSDNWYSDELIAVKVNGKWGYLDTKGNTVIAFIYDKADGFSEGLANIGIQNNQTLRYGYIDKQGKEVIAPLYATPSAFIDGVAGVTDEHGDFFLIDRQGNKTSPQNKENPQ